MSLEELSLSSNRVTRLPTYQPLLLVLIAAASGIVVDQFLGIPLPLSGGVFAASMVLWRVCFTKRLSIAATLFIYLAVGSLAAGWHHYWWNIYGVNDIGFYASGDSQPLCVEAVVAKETHWVAAPAVSTFDPIPRGESTRIVLAIKKIRHGNSWVSVSGQVNCLVRGQLPALANGSTLLISGRLSKITPPGNPGEFDFQRHLRGQRTLAFLQVNHPAAIQVIEPSSFPRSVFAKLRSSLNRSIWKYVGSEQAPLAAAILLGNREQLDTSKRNKFLVSGTVHLLAISGLHVGILAGGILFLGRLGIMPRRFCLLSTIVFVIFYAWLVEFRPPVVRAAILICIFCISKWMGRGGLSFNSLGLAALIVLVFNPTQLTNVGAQLSFLAVASLAYFYPTFVRPATTDPLDRLIERTRPWQHRLCKSMLAQCRMAFLVSGTVWLVALPLVAERFHIVAPIALLVNPLLIIPLTVGLLCGFGVLVFAQLAPPIASIFGSLCEASLGLIESMVVLSERVPASHFWTSGPGTAAVIIFYLGLLTFVIYPPTRLPKRWARTAFAIWLAFLVALPWLVSRSAHQDKQLVCTFIDVGHGTSVLLQLPNGQTVLYDCGSFGSSRRATNSICGLLWHEGISHVDLLVVSHTDLDHYNALPQLLERFSIGSVAISPVMANTERQPGFAQVLERIRQQNIPIEFVWQDHGIELCQSVDLQVLSPPQTGTGGSDNSDSIVLEFRYQGFSLLLPGDLDGPGLEAFLNQDMRHYDVVMAAHHGSKNSDPQRFVDHCLPDIFVASGDHDDVNAATIQLLEESRIHFKHTARDGAVQVIIDETGIATRHWEGLAWSQSMKLVHSQRLATVPDGQRSLANRQKPLAKKLVGDQ